MNTEYYINQLESKLIYNNLPPEFGIFFGYPLKDVIGFIGHPSLKHIKTTAWKVYGNPKLSDEVLAKFKESELRMLEMCQTLPFKKVVLSIRAIS